jgi:hypothetical protein
MAKQLVDERDVQFVMWEQLKAEKLFELPKYQSHSREEFDMILGEAKKFATEVILPINKEGDHIGVKIVGEGPNKTAKVPDCYKAAYDAFCEQGWVSAGSSEEWGGQGLPALVTMVGNELFVAACMAFTMFPGLSRSAAHLIETYGTEEQKKKYLPNLVSGKWQGTMDLTEPGAGSAVGDLKSTAKKKGDKWLINGTKIFISAGDHEMCENIIHLVLARAEGAPAGMKGVSLFLVPKFRVNPDGSKGAYNDVSLQRVEEKMGIHASPTCLLSFGDNNDCEGELIGELNKGINYMFLMMNEARIGVGVQGEATASAAYLYALDYAKQRIQGVEIQNMKDVNAPRVEIIKHPDVRRMLLTMKAYVEGMRALIYRGVYHWTMAEHASTPEEKQKHADRLALFTPVIKAYCSDMGFQVTAQAIQVYGGYGYTSEYPVEQLCRDAKIASIYEGTNGIQAMDLVGRKVLDVKKKMQPYNDLLTEMKDLVAKTKSHPKFAPQSEKLAKAIDALDACTKKMLEAGMKFDVFYPVLVAVPYLKAFGDVCLGWLWLDQMVIADAALDKIFKEKGATDDAKKKEVVKSLDEAAFYAGKVHAGRFFIDCLLNDVFSVQNYIQSGNRDALEIPENAF